MQEKLGYKEMEKLAAKPTIAPKMKVNRLGCLGIGAVSGGMGD